MRARTIVVSILSAVTTSIVNGVQAAQEKLAACAHRLIDYGTATQRQKSLPNKTEAKPVLVIADRLMPDRAVRARLSHWNKVIAPESYDEVSIFDEKRRDPPEAVRIDSYQCVFVNWDSANGDYLCGSDDVFFYFLTRRDRRAALVRSGGTLCCEYQSGLGVLHQGAYDVLFGSGEVQVIESDTGSERRIAGDQKDEAKWNYTSVKRTGYGWWHPITRKLQPTFKSRRVSQESNFPCLEGREISPYWDRYQHSVYHGWFKAWKKDWIPLFIAVPRPDHEESNWKRLVTPPQAVLLAKSSNNGILLASTLWIAGSEWKELVREIVAADVGQIRRLHRWLRFIRGCYDIFLGGIMIYCLPIIIEGFREWLIIIWPYLPLVHSGTNIWDQIRIVTVFVLLYKFWLNFIWKRPFGILLSQFIGHRLKDRS